MVLLHFLRCASSETKWNLFCIPNFGLRNEDISSEDKHIANKTLNLHQIKIPINIESHDIEFKIRSHNETTPYLWLITTTKALKSTTIKALKPVIQIIITSMHR